jgi:hypothetical protein
MSQAKKGEVVKIRKYVAAGIVLSGIGAGFAFTGTADAASSVKETISETQNFVSTNCYRTVKVETVYYTHSKTKGWVKEPTPKVTKTTSESCYKS